MTLSPEDMTDPFLVSRLSERAPVHDPASCERESCGKCVTRVAGNPPAPIDHQARTPSAASDPIVRSIGLPGHPPPHEIADILEQTAKELRQHGMKALNLAHLLAARGYPGSTLGDGGSRGSDTTSSTERHGDPDTATRWANIDHRYARLLRDLWLAAAKATGTTLDVIAHADDIDPTPAGTGSCRACNRVCRPDAQRPGNRIVAGLCPTCYKAWQRYAGPLQWSAWVAKRREGYSERDTGGRLLAVHTPEPDHDLDLSHEHAADNA